ncbi:hypothetical protein NQZ79_g7248 [Umbelopsis isabellina]|nr:hypothetical protein NQZ79_g7248 [Umbelopsis isabellina]
MLLSAPIGLYAEYSLAWCNTPVILLLSLLFTLHVFGTTVQNAAADALKDINSLCGNLDSAVFSLAHTPHALVQMLDNETDHSVKFVLNDTRQAILNAIDGVDGLLVFFIETYKSTYVCLLSLAVNGAMDAITSVSSYFDSAVQTVLNGAASGVDGIAHAIEGSLYGNDTSQSSSSVAWPNITSNWTTALSGLNTKIQNFTLQSSVDTLVSGPFQDLKIAINQSLYTSMLSTNFTSAVHDSESLQWVPCNATVLQQTIGDVETRLLSVTSIVSYTLIAMMIIVILFNLAYRRSLNQWRVTIAQSYSETSNRLDHAHAMIALRASHKPFVWHIMSLLGVNPLHPRRASSSSWLIDYISHPIALLALAYGLCGLIFTSLVLRVIEAVREDIAEQFIADADALLAKATYNLTTSLMATADQVVNNTNAAISDLEIIVNHNALGWVNTTTDILNNTLTQITSDIDLAVSTIFGGSILETAAQGLLNCLILNKIQAIENGLSWLASIFIL